METMHILSKVYLQMKALSNEIKKGGITILTSCVVTRKSRNTTKPCLKDCFDPRSCPRNKWLAGKNIVQQQAEDKNNGGSSALTRQRHGQ